MLKNHIKQLITRLGPFVPLDVVHGLNAVANYLTVGRWFKDKGLEIPTRGADRHRLFDLAATALRDAQVLYLEFGVWQGASMRYWSRLLRNERSHLHGFDSFVGLSEDWDGQAPKGYFRRMERCPSSMIHASSSTKGGFKTRYRIYASRA